MRHASKTSDRVLKSSMILRAVCITAVACNAVACDVTLTTDKNAAAEGLDNSLDSSGLVMPSTTDGVATISLPEELLVDSARHAFPPGQKPPADSQLALQSDPTTEADGTHLSVVCLQGRGRHDDKADEPRDGMRPIRDMKHLVAGIKLKATLRGKVAEVAEEKDGQVLAEISQDVECRDMVILLHGLPAGMKMTLVVVAENDKLAFGGRTKEFTFDGSQTVGLKVPFDRVDVTNDRPRIMPVGIVLFKDAAAKEVHDIVGDEAQRLSCDTQSQSCKTESKDIDATSSVRLIEIIKSSVPHVMTGALGRLVAISQLRCDDTVCTGMPMVLRGGGR